MVLLKSLNLALRFLLELCALTAVGYWGFKVGSNTFMKYLLGIGAPLLIAVIWATFGSPSAPKQLTGVARLFLELAIYGVAAAALYSAGRADLAGIFIAVVVVNLVLMYVWGQ